MYYAPHILQVRRAAALENDELGRPMPSLEGEWVDVCKCRCDDNTTKEFRSENGSVYRPMFHVVCEGRHGVRAGETVRCLNQDGTVRGEGKVYLPKSLNLLPYSEIWM